MSSSRKSNFKWIKNLMDFDQLQRNNMKMGKISSTIEEPKMMLKTNYSS